LPIPRDTRIGVKVRVAPRQHPLPLTRISLLLVQVASWIGEPGRLPAIARRAVHPDELVSGCDRLLPLA
jgi:hypothetical protein